MVEIVPSTEGLENAVRVLRDGGLVGVPTETVYGLAADARNAEAITKVYAAKGRPSFNPLIVHVDGLAMAEGLANFDPLSRKLAKEFWPGPLTLILPQRDDANLAEAVTAGLSTVATRHPIGFLADLAGALGHGIAAPSANSSGRVSSTSARHVADDLAEKIDLIVDGGECAVGLESTIAKVDGDTIVVLRAGGISVERLAAIAPVATGKVGDRIESPGQLLAHYAPNIPLRMNATHINAGEGQLAFGPLPLESDSLTLNLSLTGDVAEAAHHLFAMMKQLDASGAHGIAVQPIPNDGIGAAINDRLRRAAHGSRAETPDG